MILVCNLAQWSDVGGLMFGKIFGKHPYAQRISPKKTMEGLFGAIFLSTIVSIVFYYIG
jgi:phosphatidate cytidylyltransferase